MAIMKKHIAKSMNNDLGSDDTKAEKNPLMTKLYSMASHKLL